MISFNPRLCLTMASALLSFARLASGQTLAINNDIQTYATLASTTVTITGRSELRITGATTPITGSIINLNSADSWFFMTNIRPSVVNSTYLGQIRVNGAAAVLNTNCRIVQYADGTVVIPHSSTFAPLQVFSGSHFTGTSMSLQNYTAYNDTSLGALANNISSFKLKRGYTATIAQNASGTGISKNYVAQDGDIEVSVLPNELNDSVSFIRVFPWRWTGKKGIAGDIASGLNVRWDYNWAISRSSTLDTEYVPIRQHRWDPSLAQNWQTLGSDHLLGYNEPDQAAQANILVGDAIWSWPDLLNTGLRLGAPAVSDGGLSWLYNFMAQADAAGLRVDYVPVHYYRSYSNAGNAAGAATQFYNFLKGIHDVVKRPLWVTEFNNGANWTTDPDPTATQQAATVAAMIEMLDSTPFVERYSLYNWVEDVRRVKWDDDSLTAAGVSYRDKVSPLAYSQVIPEVPTAPEALYRFENDARDSSAYGHPAILKGGAKFTAGHTGQAVVMSGVAADGDHVQLSTRLGDSTDFTFGAWVYPTSSTQWQRVFDLGSSTTSYMFLTPAAGGSGNLRFAIANGGAEQQLNHNAPLALNTWSHVAVTITGSTGKLFVNGALVATNTGMTINPVDLDTTSNFLGKSQFAADPLFAGRLDDVQFLSYALTDANVAAMTSNTPPVFTSGTISGGTATQGVAYNGTITGSATDADAGDTITYSKAEGPAWLTVAANGTLSGTPTFADEGTNQFTVYATDSAGASAYAVLTIVLPSVSGNGTWTADADGNWGETAKWTGNVTANGSGNTANFTSLNITADRTVTLDASRTIGTLQFGDTSGAQNWTLAAANGRTVTLAVASGSPSIVVNQNTATITASLTGTAGFTKSGAGTLVLKGDNPLSGMLFVDVNGGVNSGAVRLASLNAATGLTGIQILNNNLGYSTLELDGTLGGVTTPAAAPITLSGRNNTVPAIRNIAGSNTLSGTFTIGSGGGSYFFQADAGTLILGGVLTSNATATARSLTFQGAGDITLNGVVSNGTTTAGVGIIKNNAGTLALAGSNTFSGNITINGGVLSLLSSGAVFAGGWNNTTVITINSGGTLELDRWGYGPTNATYRTQSLGGLDYNPARLVINGGTISYSGGAAGAPQNPTEAPYGPGFMIGASGATLNAAKTGDVWTVKYDSRGTGDIASTSGGTLVLTGIGDGILDKVLPGTGGLTKSGPGTWILPRANTYTGVTTVSGGTLFVNGSTAASAVTVATGTTLGGTGTIGGGVTVQSGGNLAPGAGGIGKLTATSTVTLQAGSTTRMEINKTAATRDVLSVGGTLACGGTLLVTNLGGTLAAGDSFTLFQGGTINGTFSTFTLPALDFGLMWDTGSLPGGTIRVLQDVSTYPGWAAGYVFTLGTGASTYDADGDGMANAIEWLLGANPLASDTGFLPQPLVRTLGTAEYPAAVAGKNYLTMTARVRKIHTGMTLVPQANDSLESLDAPASAGFVTSFLVSDLGDFEQRTWIYTLPIEDSTGGRGFMRLKLVSE